MTVLRSGSATDVGRVRGVNQDLALETPNLFAVADGMGGHAGGEVAARVAMEVLQSNFSRHPSMDGLQEAIIDANAAIWEQSQGESELRGMGTTLTVAALVAGADGRDALALANVGDSRAYVFSDGRITQITADHSLAEEKVRQGEMSQAEAAVHPQRHILTRALGVSSDVEVDLWELHLHHGDRILLCSDGLTNEVGASQIAEVLATVPDPTEAAQVLVRLANQHGGSDNITAVVVDVLVDDDGGKGASVVAPLFGAAAGTTSVVGADPGMDQATAAPSSTPRGPHASPASEGLTASGAPVAGAGAGAATDTRTVVPTPPAPRGAPPAGGKKKKKESRRERRKRLGIPRRITFRVVGFFLLVVLIAGAAYGVVRWYATDNWYVSVQGNHLVVYQGRPGGLLWFNPKVVDRSNVTTSQVLSARIPELKANVQEPSLVAARRYIASLAREYKVQQQLNNPTTTTTGPGGSITPGATTTTGPPATTTHP